MLQRLLKRPDPNATAARQLYETAVQQARAPGFYRLHGVPDTLDGRFELIALHVFLILHRLKDRQAASESLAQSVFDTMFADMDQSLREMGAGDIGVGPRVKKMAQAFYGRIAAYDAGLTGETGELEAAIRRNLYGTVQAPDSAAVAAMADYLRRQVAVLGEQELETIAAGWIRFAPPPDRESGIIEGR